MDSPFDNIETPKKAWFSDVYYCKTLNGAISSFKIDVKEEEIGSIITNYYKSKLDGKETIRREIVKKGKNIGKSNQTTPFEQAVLEAKSKIEEKKKDGYKCINMLAEHYKDICKIHGLNIENYFDNPELFAKKVLSKVTFNTDGNNRVKPMLANKIDFDKLKNTYVYVQPKLNGVRCLAIIENGTYKLISRDGIEYNIPHIVQKLNELPAMYKYIFDGELYIHGTLLQNLIHAIRGNDAVEKAKVEYHIYDIVITKSEQWERFYIRKQIFNNVDFVLTGIKKVKTVKCLIDKVNIYFNVFKEEGYEGAIIRPIDGLYYPGFRYNSLLKLKSDISAEFKIIGIDMDTKAITDFNWICITPEGKTFKVKAHGTIEERKYMVLHQDEYIGKNLTLSFFEYTKDKIPFHITDMIIRDYE